MFKTLEKESSRVLCPYRLFLFLPALFGYSAASLNFSIKRWLLLKYKGTGVERAAVVGKPLPPAPKSGDPLSNGKDNYRVALFKEDVNSWRQNDYLLVRNYRSMASAGRFC